jgi:hypothetical protein
MADATVPVEHLFSVAANIGNTSLVQNGPQGTRAIVTISGGTFEGPRLKGMVVPNSGGDWVTVRADGTFKLDVRITLQTDDGATIYMAYAGIGKRGENGNVLRTAPLFETGDERYAWLNGVQGIGIGSSTPQSVSYEVYALSF